MIELREASFAYARAATVDGQSSGEAAAGEGAGGRAPEGSGAGVERAAGAVAPGGVQGVSLAVRPGTCTLVCGASGSGKTTIGRLANGLAPTFFPGTVAGSVLVDGRDVAEMASWEVAARVGSVFQNPRTQFFNVDSTGEVAFGLESQGLPEEEVRRRTRETIDELGLEALADRSIFGLSGGERQRIAYASVWATRPTSLVLDEPTSNLDLASIRALRSYLVRAKEAGVAVLVAEHRLWWLEGVADEVVVMAQGRSVWQGTAREFWALPAPEVRAFGLRTRRIDDVRVQLAGGDETTEPGGSGVAGSGCTASGARPGGRGTPCGRGVPTAGGLVLEGVSAGYRDHPVLDGVSCAFFAGAVTALVGSNGAGKTTLARVACGLMREEKGSIALDGVGLPAKRRLEHSALVFQDVNYQLFAESVRKEVTFGLSRAAAERVDVEGLLSDLGLSGLEERHPATLSGGQKQRLAVACCLAQGRQVLVFDEPTSGLDCESMERVAELLRRLAAAGRVVVVVTHDLELVARACDRAVCLRDGRIAAEWDVRGEFAAVRAAMER